MSEGRQVGWALETRKEGETKFDSRQAFRSSCPCYRLKPVMASALISPDESKSFWTALERRNIRLALANFRFRPKIAKLPESSID